MGSTEHYLSDEEINDLISNVKKGDNAAWEQLCGNFDRYIHKCGWKRLRKLDLSENYCKEIEEDLYMAGWQGFVLAMKNYQPAKGKFLTYATHYIDGEIAKELKLQLNSLGLTERTGSEKEAEERQGRSAFLQGNRIEVEGTVSGSKELFCVEDAPDLGKYSAVRRTLQVLQVLRLLTDEEHSLSKDELGRMLRLYRIARFQNGAPLEAPNTLTSTLEDMLEELNPEEYSVEKEGDYKIKYEGYQEDRLKGKQRGKGSRRSSDITNFSYVHEFTYEELDTLIQLIYFSDIHTLEEKSRLINKLMGTASIYYQTPFWDGEKLKFNPGAIHGRLHSRRMEDKHRFIENLKMVQRAINHLGQIRFRVNSYTADHQLEPGTEYMHTLSPYHLVVYHDNYYCIGMKQEDKRIWHYRVDLMSDIEIVRDDAGKIVPIEVCAFAGLPISNPCWDPEKYMSEHLYMAYDEPKDIHIKIKNTDYTILHDWFGEHYEKTDLSCEEGYDIVKVRTSPFMIVHWAMQYGSSVEIMDEEIREKIREEVRCMAERYHDSDSEYCLPCTWRMND
ncbi:MAG: WYL domain-containing protein [Acetatifactor sp.]